jgi:hypothetical protein
LNDLPNGFHFDIEILMSDKIPEGSYFVPWIVVLIEQIRSDEVYGFSNDGELEQYGIVNHIICTKSFQRFV